MNSNNDKNKLIELVIERVFKTPPVLLEQILEWTTILKELEQLKLYYITDDINNNEEDKIPARTPAPKTVLGC